jgi:hypothetical protein
MQETAACEVEAKKDGCGFCKLFSFFLLLPDVHGSRGLAKRLQDQHAQVPCHV